MTPAPCGGRRRRGCRGCRGGNDASHAGRRRRDSGCGARRGRRSGCHSCRCGCHTAQKIAGERGPRRTQECRGNDRQRDGSPPSNVRCAAEHEVLSTPYRGIPILTNRVVAPKRCRGGTPNKIGSAARWRPGECRTAVHPFAGIGRTPPGGRLGSYDTVRRFASGLARPGERGARGAHPQGMVPPQPNGRAGRGGGTVSENGIDSSAEEASRARKAVVPCGGAASWAEKMP